MAADWRRFYGASFGRGLARIERGLVVGFGANSGFVNSFFHPLTALLCLALTPATPQVLRVDDSDGEQTELPLRKTLGEW
jgi:hypothetical protein